MEVRKIRFLHSHINAQKTIVDLVQVAYLF